MRTLSMPMFLGMVNIIIDLRILYIDDKTDTSKITRYHVNPFLIRRHYGIVLLQSWQRNEGARRMAQLPVPRSNQGSEGCRPRRAYSQTSC